ncbi:threonine--tRNA ligase [Streptomyces sp. NPDC051940]|uniref:threonine--tRNA ligase n=1 Tax=Streptomyces sp. NPDC051940 TaxID=3155675 RepID=UPI0034211BB4
MNAPKDHRRLGRELELFDTDPLIGSGLPYWLPAGAAVRQALESYIAGVEHRAGYHRVYSPVLGKRELYEVSGHWQHYAEDMFPPMALPKSGSAAGGGEDFVLRPSLCPHHALIYRSREHSYRELPLRIAEIGAQHRSELSGVLGGLSRVRGMQLNDAHVFCSPDQVEAEALAALRLIERAYADLGVKAARYRLSLPGEGGKYVDNPGLWERAVAVLRSVLDASGLPYEDGVGEAAFYGPKIDVQVEDAAGREFTLSTVQVDFHQPEQFGLEYVGADGARHRPVMVHRAIVGSIERAVAHLIEVHQGRFPAWLAPVQAAVVPLGDAEVPAAAGFVQRCLDRGLRAELLEPVRGTLGARIRGARLVPYQAVIGPKEAAAGEVSLRLRDGSRRDPQAVDEALGEVVRGCAV